MKAIALLSGGLDSQLALRLVLEQGIEVHVLHFASVFAPGSGHGSVAQAVAERWGLPITIQDVTEELLGIVRQPKHGTGSGLNPCIDCRIMQLRRAGRLMEQTGARFVVTGEVLGQRPMSQRRDAMRLIERQAGLEGLVVRPLCALALEPSIPEREGWVDRQRLLGLRGRQRTPQMALAARLGITDYLSPAGGCRLTEPNFARRAADLREHGELTLENVRLLEVGRHFRLSPRAKLVVGRNEQENARIEALARDGDVLLAAEGFPGPTSLYRGELDEGLLNLAARITARYGKGRAEPQVSVAVQGARHCRLTVAPATEGELRSLRIVAG